MKPEDKSLLIKDLCTRLPFYVMCKTNNGDIPHRLKGIIRHHKLWWFEFDGFRSLDCRPYLRSMSSMTEKERKEFNEFCVIDSDIFLSSDNPIQGFKNQAKIMARGIAWLLKNHFDFNGLIEKDLALEAPKDMYI